MSWLSVGAAIASAVFSNYNAQQVAKKQNRAATASIMAQEALSRKASQEVNKNIDELEKSTPEDEFQGRAGDIRAQLRAKQAMALAGLPDANWSDAYKSMAGAAAPTAIGYGDDINTWLSGIDAPMLQRQGEAFSRADVESALRGLRRDSAAENTLLNMRLANIRRNPWLDMLSTGLSAYAGTKGFGGNTMAGSAGQGVPVTNLGGQSARTFFTDPVGFDIFQMPPSGNWRSVYGQGNWLG